MMGKGKSNSRAWLVGGYRVTESSGSRMKKERSPSRMSKVTIQRALEVRPLDCPESASWDYLETIDTVLKEGRAEQR
jgi:hypothetical protein